MKRLTVAAAIALFALALPTSAMAQLHWDASGQVGVMKRVLADRPAGGKDAGFGPVAQVSAHVALLPLVRLGAYFGYEISPIGGDTSARDIAWGGLHAKLMSPWPRGALRAWLFGGFGYAGVYARSTSAPRNFPGPAAQPSVTANALVSGTHGGYFDVPFGIGASYKLRKPFELCAELGGHAGFGHHGRAYEDPGPLVTSPGRDDSYAIPSGKDQLGVALTVGVIVEL